MKNNLEFYDSFRSVPDEAKKAIQAGRLKGMTDINPMWRLKALTEVFGPCGIGWWYDIVDRRLEKCEQTNEVSAFMDILLFYKDPVTGQTSHGIPGTGGSSFVAQERNGPYMSDECFKMALTDAISVAAKPLGLGADVYYEKDRSKYTKDPEQPQKPAPAPQQPKPAPAAVAPTTAEPATAPTTQTAEAAPQAKPPVQRVTPEQAAELVKLSVDKWGNNAAEGFITHIGYARCSMTPADMFETVKAAIANAPAALTEEAPHD